MHTPYIGKILKKDSMHYAPPSPAESHALTLLKIAQSPTAYAINEFALMPSMV
jgi:hypothetical protein